MRTHFNGAVVEHRFKERKPLHLDVVIYRNHIPIAVGKTRDIGIGGMGIESDISNLTDYSIIEVEIGVSQTTSRMYYRLSGLVTHHRNHSFGMTFTNLAPAEMELLTSLMERK